MADLLQNVQLFFGSFSPSVYYNFIIGSIWIHCAFTLYLCYRQGKVCRSTPTVLDQIKSHLSKKEFEKGMRYEWDKICFQIAANLYSAILGSAIIHYGFLPYLWRLAANLNKSFAWNINWLDNLGQSIAFSTFTILFKSATSIPLRLYRIFVESNYGFNKAAFCSSLRDQIRFDGRKILYCSGYLAWLNVIDGEGGSFFIWFGVLSLLILEITDVVSPFNAQFNKLSSLKDIRLKAQITNLASKVKFPLEDIVVMRSAHSNAFFSRDCFHKRIVLCDTLIKGYVKGKEGKGCNYDQIEAIIAHELGHWSLCHLPMKAFLLAVKQLVKMILFGLFYKNKNLFKAVGFTQGETPLIVGLVIVMCYQLKLFNFFMEYLTNIFSRRMEFAADRYAVNLGYGERFKSALIKLNKDNLRCAVDDILYSKWFKTHPTTLERIKAIDARQEVIELESVKR